MMKAKVIIDKTSINIFSKEDIEYWCKKFKCEKEDLLHAVLTIGKSPKMVNDFLILNRKKKK